MTDKYITSSQYEKGLDSIKEYIDKLIPHIEYPVLFTLPADKVLEIYNSTNHAMEFDKPSNIDLNKEIIMTHNNENIPRENSQINYINYQNSNITISFHIGFDINKNTNENKMVITISYLNTNITSDLVLKQVNHKYLNNKYLKKDVAIQNSITIGTRILGDNIGKYSFSNGNRVTASGDYSHAEGERTMASGEASHAEGNYSTASSNFSHAEGNWSTASGFSSHVEGSETTASGDYSHAEGNETTASGESSHAEGNRTKASGVYSHAEGMNTEALIAGSHAEGWGTTASGDYSHTEGYFTKASSEAQHVQGKYNIEDKDNKYAHIVGNGTDDTVRSNAHTLDWEGNAWFAGQVEGTNLPYHISSKKLATVPANDINNINSDNGITVNNISINKNKMYYIEFLGIKKLCKLMAKKDIDITGIICSINNYTIIATNNSNNITVMVNKIDENINDVTFTDLIIHEEENKYLDSKYLEPDLILQNSISVGRVADIGTGSSAIGDNVEASGYCSHAEGANTTASGDYSHAEGANTTASGESSHAEGSSTASATYSHSEGNSTKASGYCSHAEGIMTIASANQSHAEGANTTASGDQSHAEGGYTIASGQYQHVQGKCNIEDTENKYAHIVGNGVCDKTTNWKPIRSNAHTLDWNGNAWFAGKLTQEGTPTDDKDLITKKYFDVNKPTVPTKTSELTNDSNFLTEHQSLVNYATIEYVDSKLTTNYVSKEELTESTKPADTTTVKTTLNDILGGDYIE